MDCPFLSSGPATCKSTSDLLAHTLFSSEEYCRGDWFTLCPWYRQHQFELSAPVECAANSPAGSELSPGAQ